MRGLLRTVLGALLLLPVTAANAAVTPVDTLTAVSERGDRAIVAGPVLSRGLVTWAERAGGVVRIQAGASSNDVTTIAELPVPAAASGHRQAIRLWGSSRALVVEEEVAVPDRNDEREPGTLVRDRLLTSVDGGPLRALGERCSRAGAEPLDLDGTRLAHLSACDATTATLRVVDLASGELLVERASSPVRPIALAGDLLAWSETRPGIGLPSDVHVLDLRTGEQRIAHTGYLGAWDLGSDGSVVLDGSPLEVVPPGEAPRTLPGFAAWDADLRLSGDRFVTALELRPPAPRDDGGDVPRLLALTSLDGGVRPVARFDGQYVTDNALRLGAYDFDGDRVAWVERQCFEAVVRVVDVDRIDELRPSAPRRACPIAHIDETRAVALPRWRIAVWISCSEGCRGRLYLAIKAGPEASGRFAFGPSPKLRRVVLRSARWSRDEIHGLTHLTVAGYIRSAGQRRLTVGRMPLVARSARR